EVSVEAVDAAHGDALAAQREQEVRHALVAAEARVRAKEPEGRVAEGPARTPGLLPAEPPAALDAPRRALEAGEVGARVRLGPPLRPQVLRRRHLPEDALLLVFGAELEDGRREQKDAVLRDAVGRAGAVVLLFEDEPLDEARLAAAVLLRPGDDRVAGLEELL